jgi:hypothetical protein
MDMIHSIHPFLFILSSHTNVSLVGDVVECLLEEVKIPAIVNNDFVIVDLTKISGMKISDIKK